MFRPMNDRPSDPVPTGPAPGGALTPRHALSGGAFRRHGRTIAIAALLFLAALALRVYRLDAIPPGAWYDESLNGLNGLQIIDTVREGRLPPIFFAREGHPQEPLYLYLIALMFRLFGASMWAVRLTSALIGALTVPVFWLALRRLRPPEVALTAAVALIFFRWHLHFSRTGFRTILIPLVVALLVWALATAVQTGRRRYWALAGATLGLGFYTYLSIRFVPLLLVVWGSAAWWAWRREGAGGRPAPAPWKGVLLALAVAVVVFAPLGVNYLRNPFHFTGRTDAVSLFQNGLGPGLRAVSENALANALQFGIPGWGDHVAKHNIPYRAVFDPLSALFFLVGVVVAVRSLTRPPGAWGALCLAWLGLMLLASVFSYGAPNILRTLGGAPAAIWLWAEGVAAIARRAARPDARRWLRRWTAPALIAAPLLWLAGWQTRDYFHVFPQSPGVWGEFTTGESDLGRYVATLDPEQATVWIGHDILAHLTFQFESGRFSAVRPLALPDAFARPSEAPARDHYVLVTRYNRDRLAPLLNRHFSRKDLARIFADGSLIPWAWMYRIRSEDLMDPDGAADALPAIPFGA